MKTVIIIIFMFVIPVVSCSGPGKNANSTPEGSHYLEIRERGVGMISLDKVPNTTVMQPGNYNDNTFFSYMVSFLDSSYVADPKKDLDMGKYYQYDMAKDWVALVNGDSVRPVFFQPAIKKTAQLNEGVIVFEILSGVEPDTLLYLDSYGKWGAHQLYLNK